jgi:hypothetical protein
MKTLLLAVTLALSLSAHAETSYTVDFTRSPNLQDGCSHYIGPGCHYQSYARPPLDRFGCVPGETWNGSECAVPRVVFWTVPASLPDGCPTRYGPGCELPNQPALTEEGCFFGERLINLFFGRPDLGQRCMVRVTKRVRYD